MAKKPTAKQRAWLERYLANGFNAAEAAEFAGYAHPKQRGHDNVTKRYLQEEMEQRFSQLAMSADEALARLTMMARGVLRTGAHETRDGLMDRFDPIKAIELLGKHYGLFTEELVLSWKQEAEQAGVSASELFEKMVAEIMAGIVKK